MVLFCIFCLCAGATSQLQFVNEIAHSLLDLAQRQIPPAEELPADHLDTTDSVILITTSTATNTTITTASTTTTITSTTTTTTTTTAVSIQSKAGKKQESFFRWYYQTNNLFEKRKNFNYYNQSNQILLKFL